MLTLLETSIQLPGISIVLSALIAVLGLIFYFASGNPKVQEVARIAFAMGLLGFLLLFK